MVKYLFAALALLFSFNAAAVKIEKLETKVADRGLFVQQTELPMVNLVLTFNAGTVFEGNYPNGTSNMLANMLMHGTSKSSAAQLSQRLDELASQINVYSNRVDVNIEIVSTTENLEETLKVLREVLIYANFPVNELKIVKSSVLQAIKQQKENPSFIAMYNARKQFYGKDNKKYYMSSMGTASSVNRISQDVLKSYFRENITHENMTINAVGDITKEELEVLLDKYLIDMASGVKKDFTAMVKTFDTHRMAIEKDLPQTTTLIYGPSVRAFSEDYYPSIVFNYILGGGGFSSRLMEEVREKRGLTYGVRSSFEYDLPYKGLFTIQLQTATKNAIVAESLIKSELSKIGKQGVTYKELREAKDFLIGSFPLRIRTSSKLLGYLDKVQRFDMDPEEINLWDQKIEAVTLEQVNEFAAKFVADETDFARIFVGRQ